MQLQLAAILDIAPDAVISVDENQCIVLFNQGAERIFGYGRADVLGQPVQVLLPDRFAKSSGQDIRELFGSEGVAPRPGEPQEIYGRRKDGTEFPAAASISRVAHRGRVTFTAILRDITERKQTEAALRQAHDEMERGVLERTQELAQANAALQEKIQDLEKFEEVAVGRELKMIALEKQIEQLKRLLKAAGLDGAPGDAKLPPLR